MAITFITSTSSTTVTVNDSSHGALVGDFVTFSNANTGNSSLNTQLNAEHQIITVPTTGTYTITLSDNAAATLASAGSADAEYQLNIGINTVVPGDGWGAGTWGADGWGQASTETAGGGTIRLWSQDNFGEDLIFNQRDGGVFYWDKTLGTSTRAKNLIELSDQAPIKSRKVIVSERDRHVICFGANPLTSSAQDRLLVRFSSQENPFLWTPTATNTAGDLRVGSGSEIVTAVKTRREIIILTDTSVHSMQFIGAPFTFGINQLASNITVRGFNSAVAVGDSVLWMGYDRFYLYDGRVQVIPCSVRDHVFNDFNETQSEKVYAGVNSAFGEVFWFYPSDSNKLENGGDGENDKYVVYNYDQQIWYVGSLKRSAWLDRGVYQYPMATDSNLVYNHESGNDNDGTAFTSFIESSPMDIQDGDQFIFLRRMLPDVSFDNSDSDISASDKQAVFSLKAQRSPGGGFVKTSTNTVTPTTELNHLRLRGRSFGLRVESTTPKVNWRLGTPRVDLRADGDR
jgi:hypothetical protein|tara:strand:- start:221 stop:1762 length:1542 start_codon:yes stop_codon:yes gene_type:complete